MTAHTDTHTHNLYLDLTSSEFETRELSQSTLQKGNVTDEEVGAA